MSIVCPLFFTPHYPSLKMMDGSSVAYDLESLKIAARQARRDRSQSQFSSQRENRTDIVHAGYRFLQCIVAGVIFICHLTTIEKHEKLMDTAFVLIYPCCFFASLILAISRIMNFIPNPTPIVPVVISMVGWSAMLTGSVMVMRHANLELDLESLSDLELYDDPIFKHDLILCAISLVGSSLYLVHAWLCYDCWWWAKKEKKRREAEASQASTFSARSDSDSGMSSDDGTDLDGPSIALPGTSNGQRFRTSSGRSDKLEGTGKAGPDQTDPITTLNEALHASVEPKQLEVEDEPVRLYCCCVEISNMIKQEYGRNTPAHEFQVVHVM